MAEDETLLGRIEHWIRAAPDRVAHIVSGRRTTYGELGAMADAVAAHLLGTLPDDQSPVAIHGHKEPEVVAAFLGCLKAGHPYVPIDLAVPAARVKAIVDAAGAALTLEVGEIAALPPASAPVRERRGGPGDALYVLFTSGSTGVPKGVVLTGRNLGGFLHWVAGEFQLPEAGGVFLNQASFGFDLSSADLYLALTRGGTVVSLTADDVATPRALVTALQASGAEYWISTPSFGGMCLADRTFGQAIMPRLKNVLFCGEILPPATAAAFLERFPAAHIWTGYGPTETTVIVSAMRLDGAVLQQYPELPVGRLMPGLRMTVRDAEGRELPDGEVGELVIGGSSVSPGYLNPPDLTERAFSMIDGWWSYRSGDLGHRRGDLYFCHGRRDHQVKLHGFRIELGDIEAHLRRLEGVKDAVVILHHRNGKPDSLRAFVVLHATAAPGDFGAAMRLRQQLGAVVTAPMVPQHVHFVPAIPLTAHGKADRHRLAELPMKLVLDA